MIKIKTVTDYFGCDVFSETIMKERLPEEAFKELERTLETGHRLNIDIANIIANAMKDWAMEKGATHYTHWFQPLTGITAEKHDSFITTKKNGNVIMEFSGKELIQGEPDASSFPSGGLRATFEARGYTAWDPTSFAFIKDGVLCIPTAFCSYGGEALDKKTPLLRSMEAINKQTLRILKLFGHDEVVSVKTTVGPEQEYFLVDSNVFNKRKDLVYTGRTLFGAMPPKGQELDDHYFGAIKPRVQAFMKDLDEELWRLGVLAKTEHNEAAPAQHELAPIFTTTNIATDHNQITMETMQKCAKKHGMICLLHEKPFEGVNGSGKHNNWSISTNTNINLLEPGETPAENAQFLLFLCAVIKAVDDYQDLLRISIASAGNDHRLGAQEAPPAIVSMFLGEELTSILESIEKDEIYDNKEKEVLKVGVHVLPRFPKDTTDRNRTSPFAFTGNKFEFRMLGSAASVAGPNTTLNTAVAEVLRQFADELECAEDFESALHTLIKRVIKNHKRIIFNGNGYDDAWVQEAKKRGLLNLPTTPDCLPYMLHDKNVELYKRHKVYSEAEIKAHYEIKNEKYCKYLNIEVLTMIDMAKKDILPCVSRNIHELADTVIAKRQVGDFIDTTYEESLVKLLSELSSKAFGDVAELEALSKEVKTVVESDAAAMFYKNRIIPLMKSLRASVDEMETLCSSEHWCYPSYGDLLFSVR